ncbi:MAG: two-component sensor histidine kinase [Flammeovirgaceae bacterium]|nr:two-component sensor histidine kinase [Flammeovirgaceae bacterium]MBE62910.1 two-component sensor histidine kinase [Flammeovirgaceae bacterium]MBR07595.1 two-component sensor histidine kinase [Rickettsiales bacterium]HCX25178.1 two-component sensor histidine kinase [Cytophagales bacterium]|tara:strand:+ start:1668 stop:3041 length:1374 start_codon:yes stop_codon:yes gene_type:complete
MKIHNKIIYALITIFLIYTLLFSGFIYYSISNYSYTDFYKRLEIRAITAAKIKLEHPQDVSIIKELNQEYLEKLPQQKEYFIRIEDNSIIDDLPDDVNEELVRNVMTNNAASANNQNIFFSGIRYKSTNNYEYVVIISAENYFSSHHVAYLRNLLFSSLVYTFILVTLISLVFSRTLVQPINNIIKEVKKIGLENLHLRLKVPEQNDSLSRLTQTFNEMLDRLETSFETQTNFISNASHELNTPLTTIIGEADLALTKERASGEYVDTIKIILSEAEKLEQKTRALLLLAQTGYDGKKFSQEVVRTDQLVLDAKETVENINSKAKITLDFSALPEQPEKLKTRGNQQLLKLALCNLVMNGCKYSNNQPVNISLGSEDQNIIIIISDQGIGIPEEEMQYIYNPYYRASNAQNYEGFGIGLPLARNIIKIHFGQLSISSQKEIGTKVKVTLPITPNPYA